MMSVAEAATEADASLRAGLRAAAALCSGCIDRLAKEGGEPAKELTGDGEEEIPSTTNVKVDGAIVTVRHPLDLYCGAPKDGATEP